MRDSDMIRKMIKAGMTYRTVATVCRCSHGSVSAEVALMKREEAEAKRKIAEQAEAEKKLQENTVLFPAIPGSEAA